MYDKYILRGKRPDRGFFGKWKSCNFYSNKKILKNTHKSWIPLKLLGTDSLGLRVLEELSDIVSEYRGSSRWLGFYGTENKGKVYKAGRDNYLSNDQSVKMTMLWLSQTINPFLL